ncbi:hypothetical protein TYRP_016712 [Tyrophagus putrescentiae]|nr:hypothetical protein TYRP_016712 [Tyrophagus putrescentiae]
MTLAATPVPLKVARQTQANEPLFSGSPSLKPFFSSRRASANGAGSAALAAGGHVGASAEAGKDVAGEEARHQVGGQLKEGGQQAEGEDRLTQSRQEVEADGSEEEQQGDADLREEVLARVELLVLLKEAAHAVLQALAVGPRKVAAAHLRQGVKGGQAVGLEAGDSLRQQTGADVGRPGAGHLLQSLCVDVLHGGDGRQVVHLCRRLEHRLRLWHGVALQQSGVHFEVGEQVAAGEAAAADALCLQPLRGEQQVDQLFEGAEKGGVIVAEAAVKGGTGRHCRARVRQEEALQLLEAVEDAAADALQLFGHRRLHRQVVRQQTGAALQAVGVLVGVGPVADEEEQSLEGRRRLLVRQLRSGLLHQAAVVGEGVQHVQVVFLQVVAQIKHQLRADQGAEGKDRGGVLQRVLAVEGALGVQQQNGHLRRGGGLLFESTSSCCRLFRSWDLDDEWLRPHEHAGGVPLGAAAPVKATGERAIEVRLAEDGRLRRLVVACLQVAQDVVQQE